MADEARILEGDCLEVLPTLEAGSVDAVVTDPPYALVEPRSGGDGCGQAFAPRSEEAKAIRRGGFMGKAWDSALPGVEVWQATLRVLKPGGYLLAFGGSRTYHRLTCAIEDAGFEIRDCLMWVYASGYPKSRGCLKPAYEPIVLARRPGPKVLPLGIDECRVSYQSEADYQVTLRGTQAMRDTIRDQKQSEGWRRPWNETAPRTDATESVTPSGRWPSNLCHDGSGEVLEAFAAFGEKTSGSGKRRPKPWKSVNAYGFSQSENGASEYEREGDTGTAARFFYCAKASKADRGEGNLHPTVKPLALMSWLVKLVCPPGGLVLDPFAGSGSTGVACLRTDRRFLGIELSPEYAAIARRRLAGELARFPLFAAGGA